MAYKVLENSAILPVPKGASPGGEAVEPIAGRVTAPANLLGQHDNLYHSPPEIGASRNFWNQSAQWVPLSAAEGTESLAGYLEGHTSMLKGCIQKSFIHVRNITGDDSRKRAYSCPPAMETPCDSGALSNGSLLKTSRHVDVLMFRPKSVVVPCGKEKGANSPFSSYGSSTNPRLKLASGSSGFSDTQSSLSTASGGEANGDERSSGSESFGSIIGALERSKYSDEYLEDLTKLDRTPIKDEDPVFSCGSGFHELNTCKPCVFYWASKGCKNGENCSFCHHFHVAKKSKEKKKRSRLSRRIALLAPGPVIFSHQHFGGGTAAPASPNWDPVTPGSIRATGHQQRQTPICCPVLFDVKRWKEIHSNSF